MNNWKGTKVVISIYRKMGKKPAEWIESRTELLDTDTISDLFSAYHPTRYEFIMIPA